MRTGINRIYECDPWQGKLFSNVLYIKLCELNEYFGVSPNMTKTTGIAWTEHPLCNWVEFQDKKIHSEYMLLRFITPCKLCLNYGAWTEEQCESIEFDFRSNTNTSILLYVLYPTTIYRLRSVNISLHAQWYMSIIGYAPINLISTLFVLTKKTCI